eukprot:6490506-Amphidinium_carterae.3
MEQGVLHVTASDKSGVAESADLVWYSYADNSVYWSVPHVLETLFPGRAKQGTLKHLWQEVTFPSLQALELAGHARPALEQPSKRMLRFDADAYTEKTRDVPTCSTRLLLHTCLHQSQSRTQKTRVRYRAFLSAIMRALASDAFLSEDLQ